MSPHEPIPSYATKEVEALFESFSTDEDREWSWAILNMLREVFPKLDHFVTGGLDKTYIDIRIGVRGKEKKKGIPIFGLIKDGGGAYFYVRKKFREGLPEGVSWWVKQQDHDIEQVSNWLLSIQEKWQYEGSPNVENGNGFTPSDYKKEASANEGDKPGVDTKGMSNNSNSPLNTIFYGPPGTGKTYNTINEALKIIDPNFLAANQKNRKALKNKFDELRAEKKIVMTTFHQSFSYEDFVEGIRAEIVDEKLVYSVKDGILKEIAESASKQKNSNFDQVYQKLCEEVSESGLSLKTLVYKKTFDLEVSNRENLIAIPRTKTKTRMTITKENLKEFILGQKVVDWKPYTRTIKEYLEKEHKLTVNSDNSNYVLIIDEINRGNVSNIFGELITLIEASKRKGSADGDDLSITLPYSKKEFGVPANLYIIGTMNTADRSLTQIDTALRRRFHFREMMPNPELLTKSVQGVDLPRLLDRLNQRIEALYDREHTLGHAFFINLTPESNISELKDVFENKIFPLLQEYFFDDWKKIQLILGKHLIKTKKADPMLFSEKVEELEGIKSYSFNNDALSNPETYKLIYGNKEADIE